MRTALAIDAGGTKLLVGVVNERGEVLARRKEAVTEHGHTAYFARCAELSRAALADAGLAFGDLAAVGMNIPGMTTPDGHVYGSPSSGWPSFEARPLLEGLLGCPGLPVFFENDINACAVAERRFGGAPDDFVWLTVSTGNGGAVFSGGKLVRGANNCAGEIGHVKVEYEHPLPCGCGGLGCLEAHASARAIERRAKEVYADDPDWKGKSVSAKDLEALARSGDERARAIYADAGKYIGRALAAAANFVNFKRAYIGGGVAPALDLMLPTLMAALKAGTVGPAADGVEVVRTALGYEAALLGAAAVAFEGSKK